VIPGDLLARLDSDEMRRLADRYAARAAYLEEQRKWRQANERRVQSRPLLPQEQRRRDRAARNLEIMRLAARGWQSADIAKKFGLHRKSVDRLVRASLDANAGAASWPSFSPSQRAHLSAGESPS